VLGMYQTGMSDEQILQEFVNEYGEQALMAPRPEGFNLAGYLVPGGAILVAGTLLGVYLARRRSVLAAETAGSGPVQVRETPASVQATPEELERLRRALAEDDTV